MAYKKKKIILLLICSIFFILLFPLCVSAEKAVGFATNIFSLSSLSLDPTENIGQIRTVLSLVMRLLFSIVGIALVVMLAIYGTQLIYAQLVGKVSDIVVKKGKLFDIFFGVALLLLSYLLLNFVNPNLLNPKLLQTPPAGVSPPDPSDPPNPHHDPRDSGPR